MSSFTRRREEIRQGGGVVVCWVSATLVEMGGCQKGYSSHGTHNCVDDFNSEANINVFKVRGYERAQLDLTLSSPVSDVDKFSSTLPRFRHVSTPSTAQHSR